MSSSGATRIFETMLTARESLAVNLHSVDIFDIFLCLSENTLLLLMTNSAGRSANDPV